jgi:hypothetical protein
MENNKYKNTQVVEIKEDFNPLGARTKGTQNRVIYKKGSQHAIRKGLLKKLIDKGLKCKEVSVDFKEMERKAALKLKKAIDGK